MPPVVLVETLIVAGPDRTCECVGAGAAAARQNIVDALRMVA